MSRFTYTTCGVDLNQSHGLILSFALTELCGWNVSDHRVSFGLRRTELEVDWNVAIWSQIRRLALLSLVIQYTTAVRTSYHHYRPAHCSPVWFMDCYVTPSTSFLKCYFETCIYLNFQDVQHLQHLQHLETHIQHVTDFLRGNVSWQFCLFKALFALYSLRSTTIVESHRQDRFNNRFRKTLHSSS